MALPGLASGHTDRRSAVAGGAWVAGLSRLEIEDLEDLVELVEEKVGRKVIAFMSANHLEPDLAAEIFVLEPRTGSQ